MKRLQCMYCATTLWVSEDIQLPWQHNASPIEARTEETRAMNIVEPYGNSEQLN